MPESEASHIPPVRKSPGSTAVSHLVVIVAAISLAVLGASCARGGVSQSETSHIPAPPSIENVEEVELPDGRIQLSFTADNPYPSSRIRDFYAEWATHNNWERIQDDEDAWSIDAWRSFEDEAGASIDQWTVQWKSPDGAKSLMLILRHQGDRQRQRAFVVLSPFYLVDPPGSPTTLGEYLDQWEDPDEDDPP